MHGQVKQVLDIYSFTFQFRKRERERKEEKNVFYKKQKVKGVLTTSYVHIEERTKKDILTETKIEEEHRSNIYC